MIINYKPVAPSNDALIKSGNKQPFFVVPFRIIVYLFGTSFLKEHRLTVIFNAITTSLVRLLENRFDSLGDAKYLQLFVSTRVPRHVLSCCVKSYEPEITSAENICF